MLILLSTSPVVGHHVVGAVDWLPPTLEHVGSLCMVSLHLLFAPIHTVFHWLLAAGVGIALIDRIRAAWRVNQVMGVSGSAMVAPGARVCEAAALAGVDERIVRVLQGSPVPAFTAGWLRPRIYVAESLPERLTTPELAAVLLHERVHADRRDPLRLSALRFLAMVAFWLPALRRVADELADEAEIDADREAAQRFPMELAAALVTLAGGPNPRQHPELVEFQPNDLLARRVRRLTGDTVVVTSRVSTRALVGAVLVLVLAWASGVMVLHPLPDGAEHTTSPHCLDHPAGPLSHLFCQGGVLHWSDRDCLHGA